MDRIKWQAHPFAVFVSALRACVCICVRSTLDLPCCWQVKEFPNYGGVGIVIGATVMNIYTLYVYNALLGGREGGREICACVRGVYIPDTKYISFHSMLNCFPLTKKEIFLYSTTNFYEIYFVSEKKILHNVHLFGFTPCTPAYPTRSDGVFHELPCRLVTVSVL